MAWHPCGLGMNWLRFAYRVKMRTSSLVDPVDVVHVQVPNDTPMFQKENIFGSRLYHPDPAWDGMGEQWEGPVCCGKRNVIWYNGAHANRVAGGLVPCGSDAVAEFGGGIDDPLFGTLSDGSSPCCTGPPAFVSHIGHSVGIDGTFHGFGNAPQVGEFVQLLDVGPPFPTSFFATSGGEVTIFPFDREGATQCTIVFDVDGDPPTVQITFNASVAFTLVHYWANGRLAFRTKFTISDNVHEFGMIWAQPPP